MDAAIKEKVDKETAVLKAQSPGLHLEDLVCRIFSVYSFLIRIYTELLPGFSEATFSVFWCSVFWHWVNAGMCTLVHKVGMKTRKGEIEASCPSFSEDLCRGRPAPAALLGAPLTGQITSRCNTETSLKFDPGQGSLM